MAGRRKSEDWTLRLPRRCPYHVESLVLLGLSALGLVGMLAYVTSIYPDLPAQIPTHFDLQGRPDAYGTKANIWILVALAVGMWVLVAVLGHFPRTWNLPGRVRVHEGNQALICRLTRALLALSNLCLLVIFWGLVLGTVGAGGLVLTYGGLVCVLVAPALFYILLARLA